MDTSQAHLGSGPSSKTGSKESTKTDNLSKDELTAVLKYGAQKMYVHRSLVPFVPFCPRFFLCYVLPSVPVRLSRFPPRSSLAFVGSHIPATSFPPSVSSPFCPLFTPTIPHTAPHPHPTFRLFLHLRLWLTAHAGFSLFCRNVIDD